MKILNIKVLILMIFVSGILQMDILNISWENLKIISVVHIFASIFLSVFYIIPFVNKHAYKYIVIKKVNSKVGWVLGFILLLIILSGFYLFFIGNTGGNILGIYSFNIHLYGSFLLLFFLFYHTKKPKAKISAIAVLLAFSVISPTSSYSFENKLLNLQTEKDVIYHNQDWTNSTKCKSCHSEIFNQWANSNHKNLVESNPYYMVMESIAGEVEGKEFKQWCMGCHNPSGLTTGLTRTSHSMNDNTLTNTLFEKDAKTLVNTFKKHGNSRLEEGVSCLTCHRITDATSQGNASYTVDLSSRKKYPFEDDESSVGKYLGHKFINAKPSVHKDSYMKPLYKDSKYCASCHDETSPLTNKQIVSTFKEWEKSPYNNKKDKSKNKTCIDCHMTYLKDDKFFPLKGVSTDGGSIKKDIKVHYFAGSNHFLAGLKDKKNENQILQLLRTSAKLDVNIKDGQVLVGVENVGAGHHLPTGVADFRELWLDITIKDANDKIVFSSGKLDINGDLQADARPFMKVFGDKDGNPVGLLFWKYEKLLSDTRIPAKTRRVESYDLKEKLNYPLKVSVKLNFRIYPQWVTSIVQKAFPALPNPPVVELIEIEQIFEK
jgi:nitrate/TMAO reductase-like tetraheme cytochrome c subunit